MHNLIELLIHLDREWLLTINGLAGNSVMDQIMQLLSAKWLWIPFYGYLFWRLYFRYGRSRVFWILVGAATLVVLTDQGSVQFFKEVFQRLRPCRVPEFMQLLYLPSGSCGGEFGFISSHAANVFGLATYIVGLMRKFTSTWFFMLLWAFLISFSRIYLAVHYPADVAGGAVYGAFIGIGMTFLVKRGSRNVVL